MPGFKPDRTSHGNYRCPYCNHKVWKRDSGAAEEHIKNNHFDEADRANDKLKLELLEREKSNLEWRLKEATKPKEKKTEYYDATVFCTTCHKLASCGMPMGVLPSNVTCPNCGVCTLHLVDNVTYWR